jgi:uncharacterized protein YbaR (Trm112 family)
MKPELEWIERWLPILRCPNSGQPLRWATDQDRARLNPQAVLVSEDGGHGYYVDQGILVLLPEG